MCVHFRGISNSEAVVVADALSHAERIAIDPTREDAIRDMFPGMISPLIVKDDDGRLGVTEYAWGFSLEGKEHAVFNTRLETADTIPMWKKAFESQRCIVPALSFFETDAKTRVINPKTQRRVQQQYQFADPEGLILYMAGIWDANRFSVMTTKPHKAVAGIHDRSPILLDAKNALHWLRFEKAEPQHVELVAETVFG